MKKSKRIVRVVLRTVVFCFLAMVLLALLIQISAVQQRLTGSLESYLEDKLQTEVNISSIRLRLPESLVLKGLYIEDTQRDTLVSVQELALNFKLNKLLSKSIQFDKLTLIGGAAELKFDKEGSNLDFLTQAFSSDESAEKKSSDWQMTFDNSLLQLEQVNFQYADARSAMNLKSQVGELKCNIARLDYQKANFDLKGFDLKNAQLSINIAAADAGIADRSVQNYTIHTEQVDLENVAFQLTLEEFELSSRIGELNNVGANFTFGKDVLIGLAETTVEESQFQFDRKSAAIRKPGFDANHINLQNINTSLADFNYDNGAIDLDVDNLSVRDPNGLFVQEGSTHFEFSKNSFFFKDLKLFTEHSEIVSPNSQIILANANERFDQLKIFSELTINTKNGNDLRYFYSEIDNFFPTLTISNKPISLEAKVQGDLRALNINQLDFSGLNSKLAASGSIKNITRKELLDLNLQIDQLTSQGELIASLLPQKSLPDSIHLPDDISLSGMIKGQLNNFTTAINAKLKRNKSLSPTRIIGRATLQNINDLKNSQFDIEIDTLLTSKEDILSFIPPGKIPGHLELPDKINVRGEINGQASKFSTNLELVVNRLKDNNHIKAEGTLTDIFNFPNSTIDLQIDEAQISGAEIARYLPDTLLPAHFQIPAIHQLKGSIRGSIKNFKTAFELSSSAGDCEISGELNDEKYVVDFKTDKLDGRSLFPTNYLDSLSGFTLPKLNIALQAVGQEFKLSNSAYSNFKINIQQSAQTPAAGLTLEGVLKEQLLKVEAIADENALTGNGQAQVNFASEAPNWDINFLLKKLDLKDLNFSENHFQIAGLINAQGKGWTENDFQGQALLSDINIQYDDKQEQIDSLFVLANLKNGTKAIDLAGDFAQATLLGNFQFKSAINSLSQQVKNYWSVDQSADFVGSTTDSFSLQLNLLRPEILTLGYIPALKKLSPAKFKANFNNHLSTVNISGEAEHLTWNKIILDTILLKANGINKELNYHVNLSNAQLGSNVNLRNCITTGILSNKSLKNSIQLFDKENIKRYEVQSLSRFMPNKGLELFLNTSQLLNYKTWNVTRANRLVWSDNELAVENWRLSYEDQSIEIVDAGKQKLQVLFDQFNLKTLSDFINLDRELITGILNGEVDLQGDNNKLVIASDLSIDKLTALGAKFGDLKINTTNAAENSLQADISMSGEGHDLKINGTYNANSASSPLDLKMHVKSLNLNAIHPLILPKFLDNLNGFAEGDIKISGTPEKPKMNGELKFKKTTFDLEQYKARFTLGDQTLFFNGNKIAVEDLSFQDLSGNKGLGSAVIATDNFRNFTIDATAAVKDFLVLNTTQKDNENYWGKLRVDALATIQGNLIAPTIEVTAQPAKNSSISYVYGLVSTQLESNEGIVEFVPSEQEKMEAQKLQKEKKLFKIAEELGIKIVLKAAVNDDLDVKIITNPISGDYFQGTAAGDLVYTQLPDGTLELNGAIEIKKGTYLFTYQQFIKRNFDVKEGGTISWTGDPYNPEMNVNVIYKVKTSPYPLLSEQGNADGENDAIANVQKQTFYVNLNVSGTPAETILTTDFEYPRIDGNINNSDINAAIDRINQNPSEQNTQAFSMILFNGFIASEANEPSFQVSDVIDVQGKINNVITQQLNNLADRYIKFVELDFGIEASDDPDNITQNDFSISIKKRFLNDRLSISLDGKTSSDEDSDNNPNQTYLDDVTIEYALTPDGRFKIKIYNERDFDDFIGGTAIKYGGSLVFSRDFDKISFKGKNKPAKQNK